MADVSHAAEALARTPDPAPDPSPIAGAGSGPASAAVMQRLEERGGLVRPRGRPLVGGIRAAGDLVRGNIPGWPGGEAGAGGEGRP